MSCSCGCVTLRWIRDLESGKEILERGVGVDKRSRNDTQGKRYLGGPVIKEPVHGP